MTISPATVSRPVICPTQHAQRSKATTPKSRTTPTASQSMMLERLLLAACGLAMLATGAWQQHCSSAGAGREGDTDDCDCGVGVPTPAQHVCRPTTTGHRQRPTQVPSGQKQLHGTGMQLRRRTHVAVHGRFV
jgi:hypothetical protein